MGFKVGNDDRRLSRLNGGEQESKSENWELYKLICGDMREWLAREVNRE